MLPGTVEVKIARSFAALQYLLLLQITNQLKLKAMKPKILVITLSFILLNAFVMAQDGKERLILIKTSMGDITAKLYNDTPKHRDNFIKLIKEGWYNDSPFHRVIDQFMIQGGQSASGKIDPGYTIEAEIRPNHIHKKGALAAARQPDQVNPEKRSSGCQFYIVQGAVISKDILKQYEQRLNTTFTEEQVKAYSTVGGTPHLDGGYTVFGEVITGFEVIDKIAGVQTDRSDRPVSPVTMSIEILE
jgi:peptidyl-prolyl cis-trans isomerase B (cyclophilin B)